MRLYLRVTHQPSGCAFTLMLFGALFVFVAAVGDSLARGLTIIALAAAGGLAWLIVPAIAHRKHAELTVGCRICGRQAQQWRAAEQAQRDLAARQAEYAR